MKLEDIDKLDTYDYLLATGLALTAGIMVLPFSYLQAIPYSALLPTLVVMLVYIGTLGKIAESTKREN